MSATYKDYYKVLGVERTSSADELKKAFRNLARKYHPDKAKVDQKESAERKFKEINEAYEVLKDPEKRKFYDSYGESWEAAKAGGGGFYGGQGSPFGNGAGRSSWQGSNGQGYEYHFEGTGFSDFFEQLFGSGRMGGDPFGASRQDRSGNVGTRGSDIESEILVTLNEVLHGSERRVTFSLRNPHTGSEDKRDFNVRIPKGVREGQRLRVAGLGGAGRGSGRAGDLYLKVRYAQQPDMRVHGQHLYYDLPVSPWEATLGAKVNVDTLEDKICINIRPGTSTGQKLRVKGKGLPDSKGSRGDLFVVPQVVCPKNISVEEKKLWEQIAKTSRFNPRD